MVIGLTQGVEQTPAWFRRHQSRVLAVEPEKISKKAALSEESDSTRDDQSTQSKRRFVYQTPIMKVKTQSRIFNTI
jgi:hypothetical protein